MLTKPFFTVLMAAVSCLLLAALLWAPEARAKGTYDSLYGFERTWNAAFRLVRVDHGLKVTEKDEAIGYIFFEYKPPAGGKPSHGSIELVRGTKTHDPVRVVVQLPEMPSHHEVVMVQELSRKLRTEYGEPKRIEKPKDGDKDKDRDKDRDGRDKSDGGAPAPEGQ